ncbi:MAG: hypothetical protein KPEEDBHJ_03663 [Anaerolineales bacterium]|nr:hypothetical protein [Anaerolineales bacterium]
MNETQSVGQEPSVVKNVIENTYQDELLILGSALFEDLLNGHTDFEDPQQGSNLDHSMIVEIIVSSISLLTALVQLYSALPKENKKKSSETEFRKIAKEKISTLSIKNLSDQQVETLLTNFIKETETYYFNSDKSEN